MMTVKQIADRAGVTKPTVTNYLKTLEAEQGKEAIQQYISRDERNIMLISDELAERLLEAILKQKEHRQALQNAEKDCKIDTAKDHKTPQNTEKGYKTDFVSFCEKDYQTPQNKPQSTTKDCKTENDKPQNEIITTLNKVIETQQAQIDHLNRTIDQYQQDKHDLKDQLNRTFEQLVVKDSQIEQLNILLSQQQQLHQTLQVKLLETEAEADEETEQPKKRGLFGIFKKK